MIPNDRSFTFDRVVQLALFIPLITVKEKDE